MSWQKTGVCPSGKMSFNGEREAARFISGMRARGSAHGMLRAYACPHCKAWHMTSVSERSNRKRHPDRKRAAQS